MTCFISCKSKIQQDYENECLKISLEEKQLNYLEKLYRVKENIEIEEKIKRLDSLINNQRILMSKK